VARFDTYRVARRNPRALHPETLLVDVQSEHLDHLETRVVVPLRLRSEVKPLDDLHPVLQVEGSAYVLVTHSLGSARRTELGRPITNLAEYRDQIVRALDILLTGF
jgi:toxin CcdB